MLVAEIELGLVRYPELNLSQRRTATRITSYIEDSIPTSQPGSVE
jgi:hypothetical protein